MLYFWKFKTAPLSWTNPRKKQREHTMKTFIFGGAGGGVGEEDDPSAPAAAMSRLESSSFTLLRCLSYL